MLVASRKGSGMDWRRFLREGVIDQMRGSIIGPVFGVGVAVLAAVLGSVAPFTNDWNDWQRAGFVVGVALIAFAGGVVLLAILQQFIPQFRSHKDEQRSDATPIAASDELLRDRLSLAALHNAFTVGPRTWAGSSWAFIVTDTGGRTVVVWKDSQGDVMQLVAGRVLDDDEKRTISFMPQERYIAEVLAMQGEIVRMGDMGHQFGEAGAYTVSYDFADASTVTDAEFLLQMGLLRRALILVVSLVSTLLERAMPYRQAAEAAIEPLSDGHTEVLPPTPAP